LPNPFRELAIVNDFAKQRQSQNDSYDEEPAEQLRVLRDRESKAGKPACDVKPWEQETEFISFF
jgi:hypothetical protein